jgi:hypothetical protein
MPDFTNPLYFYTLVIENDGKVIGAGSVKLTAEAILILDENQSLRVRVEILKELMLSLMFQCQKLGLIDVHAFLTGDTEIGRVLKKHYGFDTHTGEVLVLNLGGT